MTTTLPDTTPTAEQFAERLFGAVLGAQLVQAVDLGDRLGWYRALRGGDALTSAELAARTGTAERYAREWLEHQAVCGVPHRRRRDRARRRPPVRAAGRGPPRC